MKRAKRLLALNLALLFVIALLPLQALAADIPLGKTVSYTKTSDNAHETMTFTAPESGFYQITVESPDHPGYSCVNRGGSTYASMVLYSDKTSTDRFGNDLIYWINAGETQTFYLGSQVSEGEDNGVWNIQVDRVDTPQLSFGTEQPVTSPISAFTPTETGGYILQAGGAPQRVFIYNSEGVEVNWIEMTGRELVAGETYYFRTVDLLNRNQTACMAETPREDIYDGYNGNQLRWKLSDDGVLTIFGSGEADWHSSSPARFYKDEVREIVIGKDVIVNEYTFGELPNVQKITVEEGNTSCVLDDEVLYNADRTNIYFVTGAKTGAFTIPETVSYVGRYAFRSASGLDTVTIDKHTNCSVYAFFHLNAPRDVYYNGSLEQWCDYIGVSFHWTEPRTRIHFADPLIDGNFQYALNESGDSYAVVYCNFLTSVESEGPDSRGSYYVPESFNGKPVTKICADSFYYTNGDVYIPKTITEIEDNAFEPLNIQSFIVDPENPAYCDWYGDLYTKDMKEFVARPGSSRISNPNYDPERGYPVAEGTERIHSRVFYGFAPEKVDLPLSLKQIDANAFISNGYIQDVYYAGTAEDWAKVNIVTSPDDVESWQGNNPLLNATMHFAEHTHQTELKNAKDASCTEAGYTGDKVCTSCGKMVEQGKTIPAKGHTWGAWTETKAATETAEGVETRICSVCGKAETRSIPRLEPKPADPSPKPDDTKPADPIPPVDFKDVPEEAYYATPVAWAVDRQITDGTSETTFSPEDTCTRGQIVTFLWRAAEKPEPKSSTNPFTDVQESDYFYKAVLWAVEQGITDGTSETTFSPNDGCTRGQVVTFMHRANTLPEVQNASNPFADVTHNEYYYDAVLWAVQQGITDGTSDTTFSPNDTCTRGQIVTFLYRDMAE